jgi:hypothetical protein
MFPWEYIEDDSLFLHFNPTTGVESELWRICDYINNAGL